MILLLALLLLLLVMGVVRGRGIDMTMDNARDARWRVLKRKTRTNNRGTDVIDGLIAVNFCWEQTSVQMSFRNPVLWYRLG